MRVRIACVATLLLTAAPVFAQNPEVTGPRTLNVPMVMCTDSPAVYKPMPRLVVFGAHKPELRLSATEGLLVVKRVPDDGLAVGQRYITQRIHGDPQKFPKPGEGYGDLRISGWLTIRAVDEINALAEIDFACDSIEPGDLLEPYAEPVIPVAPSTMEAPDFSDRADILFGTDNRVIFGDGDVMSINRGTLHGVLAGARYAVYRDMHNGLPLIHIGEAVVLVTSEQTSKVAVTKAIDAIQPGDIVVPRRVP